MIIVPKVLLLVRIILGLPSFLLFSTKRFLMSNKKESEEIKPPAGN